MSEEIDLNAWCERIIEGGGGFNMYVQREGGGQSRVDIAKWVLRCLGNVRCEDSDKVLEAIARHRGGR